MAEQSQEVALREATQGAIAQFQEAEFVAQLEAAAPPGVTGRQIARAAATAVLGNNALVAKNLRPSLLLAALKCSQWGLLPDGVQAAFVVYKTKEGPKVQALPMIGGLRKAAGEQGWMIDTKIVYENDSFDPDYDTGRPNHKPARLGTDRGKMIGAYAAAVHRDGRRMLEVMSIADMEKVRNKSSKAAKTAGAPWTEWTDRMYEKTVGKRIAKKIAADSRDSRLGDVADAFRADDPADALYGPSPEGEPEFPSSGSPAAQADGDIEEADWTADEPSDEDDLNEPSDEELAALGSDDPVEEEQTSLDDEPRFEKGKYTGKTCAQIYADGNVGVGWLRWAYREWKTEPMRAALDAFAEEHPDIKQGE